MRYASLRHGLVGAWCPSLGATGYRLLDRSGYGNHGTLVNMDAGTDWVGGPRGTTLDFDGANDRVSIGSSVSNYVWPLNSGTVSAWVYLRSFVGTSNFIYQESDAIGTILLLRIVSQKAQFGKITSNWSFSTDSANFPLNTWRHLCGTTNTSNTSLYVDGVSVATAVMPGPFARTPINRTICSFGSSGFFADARIDDVRTYNRELTPSEIRLLASEPGIGLKPERVSVYFGESLSSRRRKILTGLT